MKITSSLITLCAVSVLSTACMKVDNLLHTNKSKKKSRVTSGKMVSEQMGDEDINLMVYSEDSLKQAALNKSVLSLADAKVLEIINALPQGDRPAESIQTKISQKNFKSKSFKKLKLTEEQEEESLVVGFPISLIGEQNVFGGVITQVTDKDSQLLGGLKLTDLPPIHVRTLITRGPEGIPMISLVGCFNKCDENSDQQALLNLPIVGYDQEKGLLILEMSSIGKELDLISMLDPKGDYTQLKAISSATTSVEYDMKTLIFDIKTKMIPVSADPTNTNITTTDFSVRWYLKLNSDANPAFVARAPRPEVGFFKTERAANNIITRFSTTGDSPIKYYIKNVPEEYKKPFAGALDSWNVEFKKILGKEMISYEFIDKEDPRAALLVPGDIRFNIIEWDLVNKAGYGGLGPSIANQYTGQTMSANVLIQGPTIVDLYKKWFGVSQEATQLMKNGLAKEANELIRAFNKSVESEMKTRMASKFRIKLGKNLEMNIHSQKMELEDNISSKQFELIPEGMTYEKYMEGYLLEMVAHEIGHNLGLRHNFKGNLGAIENQERGSVSRSIMEYLGRPYRHLNTIGAYDRMAIAYGYKGVTPKHANWFCTDEDQGSDPKTLAIKSPECTKSDATSDPFSFWEARLARVIDLLIDTQSAAAPVWKLEEVSGQLSETIIGLSAYALSAENTADTWTNFFFKGDRPEDKSEVKGYVLSKLQKQLCNPELQDIINAKESVEAQKIAQDNLSALSKAVSDLTTALNLYTAENLKCD